MARATACILMSLLLAGCTGANIGDDRRDPTPGSRLPLAVDFPDIGKIDFAPPMRLGFSSTGVEPAVAAAHGNDLYVVAMDQLFRSRDAGQSWSPLGRPACYAGAPACLGMERWDAGVRSNADGGDLAIGPDGRLHFVSLMCSDQCYRSWTDYYESSDGGDTWTGALTISPSQGPAYTDSPDRPWITLDDAGNVYALWRNVSDVVYLRVRNGVTNAWAEPSVVGTAVRAGPPIVEADGQRLIIPIQGDNVSLAKSDDAGKTWTFFDVPEPTDRFKVGVITGGMDVRGSMGIAWAEDPNASATAALDGIMEPSVFLAVTDDRGVTWTGTRQISPIGHTAVLPWLAVRPDGAYVAVWYGKEQGGTVADPQGEWRPFAALGHLSDRGTPRVVPLSDQPTHVGAICAKGALCLAACEAVVDAACVRVEDRNLLDYFEAGFTADGFPLVAFGADSEDPALRRMGADVWVTVGTTG